MTVDLEVSVVVATYNRASLLPRLINALDAQEGARFEVIVVDDASSDATPAVLERLPSEAHHRVQGIRLDRNSGPAAARNAGWHAASAPIVVFTDDDCVPQPGWLATLLRRVHDGFDIVQGRTTIDPDQVANRGPFSREVQVLWEEGFYETCNIAYRREVLVRLGGFDESFQYPFGEDTDLAWRAIAAGARTVFDEDALVHHDVWPSRYASHLRDMPRRDGLVAMLQRHPDLRAHLGKRVFWHPLHPAALAAAAGLTAAALRPRSPLALAAALSLSFRYAWICRKHRHRPPHKWQWAAVVPLSFVADLYTVAVMAKASVKYRTLLL